MEENVRKIIHSFVKKEPRSIQEISKHIGKSWVTTNKYVAELVSNGRIRIKTFRKGSNGALKLVYWNYDNTVNITKTQEYLYKEIMRGRHKDDFSPFEIYQVAEPQNRSAFLEIMESQKLRREQDLFELLEKAKKRVLIFSGNLSWTGLEHEGIKIEDLFLKLAKRGVKIKIISRIEIPGINNIIFFNELNRISGNDFIEIRHNYQPLRAFIIDNFLIRLKEEADPKNFKEGELNKKTFIFYTITDKEWIEWLESIFNSMYEQSIPLETRMDSLKTIQNLVL